MNYAISNKYFLYYQTKNKSLYYRKYLLIFVILLLYTQTYPNVNYKHESPVNLFFSLSQYTCHTQNIIKLFIKGCLSK